ncbi:unnamed protein product, partial [Trichobilharzia regenti]
KEQEEAEKRREKNIQIAQELKAHYYRLTVTEYSSFESCYHRDVFLHYLSILTSRINEHEVEKERQRAQLLAEGEELRRIAIADHLEREKLEQIYRDQMRKLTNEFHDQISGHKQMKEIEKLQDEEIEEKCRLFAAAKIKMTKMRIMKEREIFKYVYAVKEKLEKQAKIIREINEHRLHEIDRHRKELEKEKEAEYNEVRERIAAELAVAEYENACKAKRLEEIKGLSRQLLQESIDKRENAIEERKKEIEIAGNENKLIQIEENIFQDYAYRVINHCRANGRNVYPLEKAAHTGAMTGLGTGLPGKPSLVKADVNELNNTQTDDDLTNTEVNKSTNNNNINGSSSNSIVLNGNKTNKKVKSNERLGFVW